MELGQKIKKARLERGLTQQELGDIVGVAGYTTYAKLKKRSEEQEEYIGEQEEA